jgi:hypothetical protein
VAVAGVAAVAAAGGRSHAGSRNRASGSALEVELY